MRSVVVGGLAVLVLAGCGGTPSSTVVALPQNPAMGNPAASGQQVVRSISRDFCGRTYSSGGGGLGDHEEYGFRTIDCSGPSGGAITFGVFRDRPARDLAARVFNQDKCQNNGQIDHATGAAIGPLWIAFFTDSSDMSRLKDAGGTRMPCRWPPEGWTPPH
jgi:hypothetical protein